MADILFEKTPSNKSPGLCLRSNGVNRGTRATPFWCREGELSRSTPLWDKSNYTPKLLAAETHKSITIRFRVVAAHKISAHDAHADNRLNVCCGIPRFDVRRRCTCFSATPSQIRLHATVYKMPTED